VGTIAQTVNVAHHSGSGVNVGANSDREMAAIAGAAVDNSLPLCGGGGSSSSSSNSSSSSSDAAVRTSVSRDGCTVFHFGG
jgi:hypothetical protein